MSLSKFRAEFSTPDIAEKPHQPMNFTFPKREFGKKIVKKSSFQSSWFKRYTWLHYDEERDVAFCHTCVKAYKEKKIVWSSGNVDPAFISTGFCNWKDASVKLKSHESSNCHHESVTKIFTLPSTTEDIGEALSKQHKQEKLERRHCFLKILASIRFLARQGLALRGDDTEDNSNFIQLLKLQGEDDPKLLEWVKKKYNKYTSAEVQNEMLQVMALQLLRDISRNLHSASFYTIMVDETTDVSNHEQVVLCLRWVDECFSVHEEFIGLYFIEKISADSLVQVIKDVLLRMNLTLSKARGQCYDGAANMSGAKSGVAKQLTDEEPRALYTHCYGHALNLACADAIKQCKLLRDTLDTTYEITKLIRFSPRRNAIFANVKQSLAPDTPGIRQLCPTRWTVRADALKSIIENYQVLQETWDESLEAVKDSEMRARLIGVSAQMNTFNYYFGAVVAEMILSHSDNLSRTLQKADISAAAGQDVAELTVKTLSSLRSEDKFDLFWEKLQLLTKDLDIGEPQLPRRRKTPRRYEIGSAEGEFAASPKTHYRQIYYEGLDLIVNCIKNRFDQPGFKVYRNLQELLLKASTNTNYQEEYDYVTKFYADDFDPVALKTQLELYSTLFTASKNSVPTIQDVFSSMRDLSAAQKSLLSEVCTLTKLVLVMPATNAVSERSFSALRYVKTYLRSTMSQKRLNHLMILYIHKNLTDGLNLVQVANEFVSASEHRLTVFGTFDSSDM